VSALSRAAGTRVVVEHLVEIFHAVEQPNIGMLRLDAQVLLHNGRVDRRICGLCKGKRGDRAVGHSEMRGEFFSETRGERAITRNPLVALPRGAQNP
jgi:hypothetical protein